MMYAPAVYTKYGEFFCKQGRSKDFNVKGCVTLCIATYKHNISNVVLYNECMKMSTRYPSFIRRSIHSEEYALDAVQCSEKLMNSCCIRLELYSSMSPCFNCCNHIRKFISLRPYCEVYIAFTCVYRHAEEKHISALQALNALRNVKLLDVFTVKEWCLLRERGIVMLSDLAVYQMQSCDSYWRTVLHGLMTADRAKYEIAEFSEDIKFDGGTEKYSNTYCKTKIDPEKVKMYEDREKKITLLQGILLFIFAVVLAWIWYSRYL